MRRLGGALARRMGLTSIARRRNGDRLLIVCYHGVVAAPTSDDWLLLPLAEFERQIEHLARHYRVLPLDVALSLLDAGDLAGPTACITFDDGYANNLTTALPVLRCFGVPATVYLVTGLIGSDRRLWTTRIEYSVLDSSVGELAIGDPRIDGNLGATVSERRRSARRIKEHLKRMDDERRLDEVEAVIDVLGETTRSLEDHRLLSHDELAALDADGCVSFGAHTHTHPILSRLSDSRLQEEIALSVRAVGQLQNVSRTFAYPNGRPEDYDGRAREVLSDAGIPAAVTTVERHARRGDGPYDLPRLVVGGDMDFDTFVLAASGLRTAVNAVRST